MNPYRAAEPPPPCKHKNVILVDGFYEKIPTISSVWCKDCKTCLSEDNEPSGAAELKAFLLFLGCCLFVVCFLLLIFYFV